MQQTVKREDRLRVPIVINYPDVQGGNKAYFDANRNHLLLVDGIEQPLMPNTFRHFRLRSKIEVRKRYGKGLVDSTFIYRVGENFAEYSVKGRKTVRVEIGFEKNNALDILDDTSTKFKIIS